MISFLNEITYGTPSMHGVKIGHFTDDENGSGISVFLFENAASGAYLICGSAPASHELAVLDPENTVPTVQGLCLSGGSAYGLFSASGVMSYLAERGIGHPTIHGVVPIVPAAAIYDLAYKNSYVPNAEQAYQACVDAREDNHDTGQIGCGTGATIGKIIPHAIPMTGGIGRASIMLANSLEVTAYAVVNCVGDVWDERHRIVAGACDHQGKFYNCTQYLMTGQAETDLFLQGNSTLAVVMTNAFFVKDELKRICKMAVAGIARAVSPIFTRYDGDIIFSISAGEVHASELTVGTLAAEAVRLAILDAVKKSRMVDIQ